MKSTGLIQLVGNLHQAGKIHSLHQVCGVFGCTEVKGINAPSIVPSISLKAHWPTSYLVRFGNTRPYVSGNVAHNMASEVVALLRNLMQVNSTWSTTVKDALIEGLDDLSSLVQRLNDTYETDESDWCTTAQQVLATLCTLGGFKETVRPGCVAVVRV